VEFPLSPLLGIQAAVLHENPQERLSPKEALEAYTLTPAVASGEEHSKGTLEVGKLADVVVLSENPLDAAAGAVHAIQVTCTVMNGRIIFGSERILIERGRPRRTAQADQVDNAVN
jgi:predicted amidohydrolase YtcJ